MKNLSHFFFLFLLLGFQPNIQAQAENGFDNFYQLFRSVSFDKLQVYTDGMQYASTYPSESLYPFKGKKIATAYLPYFESKLADTEDKQYFAVYNYAISSTLNGLIIREYDENTQYNKILLLVCSQKNISTAIELASDYYSEGGNGKTQSWIADIDNDEKIDIVSRHFYEYYKVIEDSEDDIQRIYQDSFSLHIANDELGFNNLEITDTTLHNQMLLEFPFHFDYVEDKLMEKIRKVILKN